MIKIERKQGWDLCPNDKVVNAILKQCEKNGGLCPCVHDEEDYEGRDLHCPCTDYLLKDLCECGLYFPTLTTYIKNRIKCFITKAFHPHYQLVILTYNSLFFI